MSFRFQGKMTQPGMRGGCFVAGGRSPKLSLWTLIACWLVVAPAAWGQDSEATAISLLAQYADTVILTPSQPEVERQFAVDGTDEALISIISNSHTVDISLIDPSGSVHPADSTDRVVTSSSTLLLESDEGAEVSRTLFGLSNPPAGIWRYRVRETAGFSGVRAVIFTMTSSSDIVAGLLGAGQDYRVGRPIALNLLLAGEEGGIPPASVTSLSAVVHRGGEQPTGIDFRDDGNGQDENANDGIYTAEFSVEQIGDYTVAASVAGNSFRIELIELFKSPE